MGRSHSIGVLNLSHVNWVNNCMTVEYSRDKTHRKGGAPGCLKHIYANPRMPWICPILSFAIYIFCIGRTATNKVFVSNMAESRFSKILRKLLVLIPGIELLLCSNIEDIGTHSNRKGSVSYVLSFVVISAVQVSSDSTFILSVYVIIYCY